MSKIIAEDLIALAVLMWCTVLGLAALRVMHW